MNTPKENKANTGHHDPVKPTAGPGPLHVPNTQVPNTPTPPPNTQTPPPLSSVPATQGPAPTHPGVGSPNSPENRNLKHLAEEFRAVKDDPKAIADLADKVRSESPQDAAANALCDRFRGLRDGAAVHAAAEEIKAG